ncbi:MAG: peptidoglycan-binding domain-containing protein [Patescibacteria group bacterium]
MRKLIIIIIIALAAGLGLLLFLTGKTETPGITDSDSNLFPSGGETNNVNDTEQNINGNSNFPGASNPTGQTSSTNEQDASEKDTESSQIKISNREAKRISNGPVVGVTSIGNLKGVNLVARFVERGTGNIWDYRILANKAERISGTTVARVQDVYWGNLGQSLLMRYQDNTGEQVKNYLGRIQNTNITGEFLPDNIIAVVSAPVGGETISCPAYLTKNLYKDGSNDPVQVRKLQNFLSISETGLYDSATISAVTAFQKANSIEQTGNVGPLTRAKTNSLYCQKSGSQVIGGKLFYITTDSVGKGTGIVNDFDNTKNATLFSGAYSEWQISWPARESLILTSKPEASTYGYAYILPSQATSPYSLTATVKPLLRQIKGLTVNASPTLTRVLYTQATPRALSTHILDTQTNEARVFPLNTFPREKCVWDKIDTDIVYCAVPHESLSGTSLDAWYKGLLSTNDSIYKINTDIDSVELIYSSTTYSPDVKEIVISEKSEFIFYIDKRDGYLWALPLISI